MLIQKSNPVGVDAAIKPIQEKLHTALLALWGIQSSSFMCYPRCHRNKTDDGFTADWYVGKNEYKTAYWDDTKAVVSFFGISDEFEIGEANTAKVHLVMFVNMEKVKPSATDRPDEEIRTEVLNILDAGLASSPVRSVELTIENALREYPGSIRDERLKFVDMNPVHCFRVNLELMYPNINNCEPISNI